MNPETKALIEAYLLAIGDWVSTEELCNTFHVKDRQLRQVEDMPGLCSSFAISRHSKGGGFKHIDLATTTEWEEFRHKKFNHGVSEIRNVRELARRRIQAVNKVRRVQYEKDTGQGLLIPVGG